MLKSIHNTLAALQPLRHEIAGDIQLRIAQVDKVMKTGTHLGVAKVTDLQPGCWPAIKQCVFQLEISMTYALQNIRKRVPDASCTAEHM